MAPRGSGRSSLWKKGGRGKGAGRGRGRGPNKLSLRKGSDGELSIARMETSSTDAGDMKSMPVAPLPCSQNASTVDDGCDIATSVVASVCITPKLVKGSRELSGREKKESKESNEGSIYHMMTKHIGVPQGKRKPRVARSLELVVGRRMSTRTTPVKEMWESLPDQIALAQPSGEKGNVVDMACDVVTANEETCEKPIDVAAPSQIASERTGLVEAHQEEMAHLVAVCAQQVADVQSLSESKMQELTVRLDKVSKDHSDALCELSGVQTALNTSQMELQDCREKQHDELNEKILLLIAKLHESQDAKTAEMHTMKAELEKIYNRHIQEATKANAKEVQLLKRSINEREKALEDLHSERTQLMTRCQKLEAAQESLNSGSYANVQANPTMLQEVAYQSVYMATMQLGKILVEFQPPAESCSHCAKGCQRTFLDLQRFFCTSIGLGVSVDIRRPVQMKHAWGHRICNRIFVSFDDVSFGLNDLNREDDIKPLNLKTHAEERYRSYMQLKDVCAAEMFAEYRKFRKFCVHRYQSVFTSSVVQQALHPQYTENREISRDGDGRFAGDEEIHRQFLVVAKAVWLLHHLAFSFDPPASILRMARVTLFDGRYHNPGYEETDDMSQAIPFIVTPTLRVRNTIIRSRVYLPETGTRSLQS